VLRYNGECQGAAVVLLWKIRPIHLVENIKKTLDVKETIGRPKLSHMHLEFSNSESQFGFHRPIGLVLV